MEPEGGEPEKVLLAPLETRDPSPVSTLARLFLTAECANCGSERTRGNGATSELILSPSPSPSSLSPPLSHSQGKKWSDSALLFHAILNEFLPRAII